MGAGRTEVARAIFGADPLDSGEIFIKGKRQNIENPSDAVQHGIGYLSEDRKQFGLLVGMDVKTNIAMASMEYYVNPFGWMRVSKVEQQSEELIQRLRIKTPSGNQLVKNLSGGINKK